MHGLVNRGAIHLVLTVLTVPFTLSTYLQHGESDVSCGFLTRLPRHSTSFAAWNANCVSPVSILVKPTIVNMLILRIVPILYAFLWRKNLYVVFCVSFLFFFWGGGRKSCAAY